MQSVAVRRSTGNDVSGHYFHHYFLFFLLFFSFFLFFSPSSIFLIEGVLGSKNLFSKSGSKWPITSLPVDRLTATDCNADRSCQNEEDLSLKICRPTFRLRENELLSLRIGFGAIEINPVYFILNVCSIFHFGTE